MLVSLTHIRWLPGKKRFQVGARLQLEEGSHVQQDLFSFFTCICDQKHLHISCLQYFIISPSGQPFFCWICSVFCSIIQIFCRWKGGTFVKDSDIAPSNKLLQLQQWLSLCIVTFMSAVVHIKCVFHSRSYQLQKILFALWFANIIQSHFFSFHSAQTHVGPNSGQLTQQTSKNIINTMFNIYMYYSHPGYILLTSQAVLLLAPTVCKYRSSRQGRKLFQIFTLHNTSALCVYPPKQRF